MVAERRFSRDERARAAVVDRLHSRSGDRTARTGAIGQTIGIDREVGRDRFVAVHRDGCRQIGPGSVARPVDEVVAGRRHGRQLDHRAVIVSRLVWELRYRSVSGVDGQRVGVKRVGRRERLIPVHRQDERVIGACHGSRPAGEGVARGRRSRQLDGRANKIRSRIGDLRDCSVDRRDGQRIADFVKCRNDGLVPVHRYGLCTDRPREIAGPAVEGGSRIGSRCQ